jgi:hypothetical protein
MEENNFNNEAPVETPVEASVAPEPVVEAPMPETKVEEVAVQNNIEASVSEVQENVTAITTADLARGSDTVQAVGSVANGVIGVTQTPRSSRNTPATAPKTSNKTEAIYSTKNVSWPGVGKVYRGYNIVTPQQRDKWLERDHIRIATPEEVAREFGR